MFFDDIDFLVTGKLPSNNDINSSKLVDCKIGYARGNMFKDEYVPYKNYKAKEVIPETEEEALLLKINESEFALNDISLYFFLAKFFHQHLLRQFYFHQKLYNYVLYYFWVMILNLD